MAHANVIVEIFYFSTIFVNYWKDCFHYWFIGIEIVCDFFIDFYFQFIFEIRFVSLLSWVMVGGRSIWTFSLRNIWNNAWYDGIVIDLRQILFMNVCISCGAWIFNFKSLNFPCLCSLLIESLNIEQSINCLFDARICVNDGILHNCFQLIFNNMLKTNECNEFFRSITPHSKWIPTLMWIIRILFLHAHFVYLVFSKSIRESVRKITPTNIKQSNKRNWSIWLDALDTVFFLLINCVYIGLLNLSFYYYFFPSFIYSLSFRSMQ